MKRRLFAGLMLGCLGCTERLEILVHNDVTPPVVATCDPVALPEALARLPPNPLGDGTPESCSGDALAEKVSTGGVITFHCGEGSITIRLNAELVVNTDLVIDGGDLIADQPRVALRANNTTRALVVHSPENGPQTSVQLKNLRIEDGRAAMERSDDDSVGGGAIFNDGGQVIVDGCSLTHNSAGNTGGAIGGRGSLVVRRSSIWGNTARKGGGIGMGQGEIVIVDSTIDGNSADENGGGVYIAASAGRMAICGSTISANTAVQIGGGLYASDIRHGQVQIEQCAFVRNRAGEAGKASGKAGAIYTQGCEVTLTRSTVSANEATMAAGVWTGAFIAPSNTNLQDVAGVLSFENLTIAENHNYGSQAGGGVWLAPPVSGEIKHCTIVRNRAGLNAGIAGAAEGVTLSSSIVVNEADKMPVNCGQAYGASAQPTLQFPADSPTAMPCAAATQFADPLLDPLGDYGGPTQTVRLRANSPALGASRECPAVDQRGKVRPQPCALGAYEPD
jgi:hypothetical protein